MTETLDQIKKDEGGYQAEVYLCSAGKRTWLIGRNIQDRPITAEEWSILSDILKNGGTQEQWAEMLFDAETDRVTGELKYNHNFNIMGLPWGVQVILINMAFNMGTTRFNPKKWPKFFAAVDKKDYKEAARQMVNSKWFKDVGVRSKRLTRSMQKTML